MKRKHTILIAEDDDAQAKIMQNTFEDNHYHVLLVDNGRDALDKYHEYPVDIMLLDIDMPEKSGLEVTDIIRTSDKQTLIVIMTGEHLDEKDCIDSYERGATSYIRKPFSHTEVLMHINALLKSLKNMPEVYCFGNSILNHTLRTLKVKAVEYSLNKREYEVLSTLLLHKNQPVKSDILLKAVWRNSDKRNLQMLKNIVSNLKKKLAEDEMVMIKTEYGIGYSLVESVT